MAIEKSSFKASRIDSEFSPVSRETMSTDEDELQRRGSAVESDDDDDEFDDVDSGAGSDDCDMLELGESGAEFCQVHNQTCSVPFELYDLPGLEDILSLDVWNECLTEEERFNLTKYLPDMDQETFMRTLKELFTGCNFHFGSPIRKLFDMLQGGLCEPRVALYRKGMIFFQKRQHYHLLRKHQNYLVSNLHQIRETWLNYRGYGIEEKLRVLNIMRSQRSLMYERSEDFDADSSGREESAEALWSKRSRERKVKQKMGHHSSYSAGLNFDFPLRGHSVAAAYGKKNPKGMLKLSGTKMPSARELSSGYPSLHHGFEMKSGLRKSAAGLYQQNKSAGYDTDEEFMIGDDNTEDPIYGIGVQRDRIVSRLSLMEKAGVKKMGKKGEFLRANEFGGDSFMNMPPSYGRNKNVNQFSEIQALPLNSSSMKMSQEYSRKAKYPEVAQHFGVADQMKSKKRFPSHLPHVDLSDCTDQFWHNRTPKRAIYVDSSLKYDDSDARSKKWTRKSESPDLNIKHRASSRHKNERYLRSEFRTKASKEKIKGNYMQNGLDVARLKGSRMLMKNEETESESSEQSDDEDDENNPLIRSMLAYPSGVLEGSQPFVKSGYARKSKLGQRDTDTRALDVFYSRKMVDIGSHLLIPESDKVSLKARKKGKAPCNSSTHSPAFGAPEALFFPGSDDKRPGRLEKRGASNGDYSNDRRERYEAPITGYKRATKKRKGQENVIDIDDQDDDGKQPSDLQEQVDGSASLKKRGKRKLESDAGALEMGSSDLRAHEVDTQDVPLDTKPQKKAFTLITPTVHNSFSFSVVHLLSAIRIALITPLSEDSLDVGKPGDGNSGKPEADVNGVGSFKNLDVNIPESTGQLNLPSLTVQEIVNRVRSNPGDPCILETQEPLQDLVRGVLKIFSSKTAPLGAKGWKPLVAYEKSTKNWLWTGPVSQSSADNETIEEVTSPEAWGLPYKMLVKLVDAFANWLKNGQETLQQIGSLPAPPLSLMQVNLDEKERFRDLRAQKSLNTISASSEEVRAYFRKEEVLRYLIPDRAFSYTAADGKKSIVAPLKRCGGKPTSKARDHFMLKRDRPPHVTILCLVRDAAARLPGSIGTRADVCTLIRDSQYIVEDVSDAQINQVVSGALDRLHYERDPCVQFDGDRKLWVYLHRDRDEEDFEDDGTSSTKKWKRPKKDATEQSDQGAVTIAYHGTREQGGLDLCSDLNVEPSCLDDDREEGFACKNVGQDVVENVDTTHGLEEANGHHNHPSVWEPHKLTPMQETKLLCQENSTNEDFDDETFVGEKPVG